MTNTIRVYDGKVYGKKVSDFVLRLWKTGMIYISKGNSYGHY